MRPLRPYRQDRHRSPEEMRDDAARVTEIADGEAAADAEERAAYPQTDGSEALMALRMILAKWRTL